MTTLPPKQLTMVTDQETIRNLPEVPLPHGYVLRSYRSGDENSWAATLQECGFEKWNEAEVLAYLEDPERREGSRVVEHHGRVVAATFASRIPSFSPDSAHIPSPAEVDLHNTDRQHSGRQIHPTAQLPAPSGFRLSPERRWLCTAPAERERVRVRTQGVLDFVVTHPDHRSRGLGRATCTAVSKFFIDLGCKSVSLLTDDWRLPAIYLYLSLGFKPVMNRIDMPERWATIYKNLKETGRDHPNP